jgi:hypothetical protein
LLEEIRRKTPGKKKRNNSSSNESPEQSPSVTHHSLLDSSNADLRNLIQSLQAQVDDLRTSHATLETTLESMNKMDHRIINELANFQLNMKARDEMLSNCLKLTHIKKGRERSSISEYFFLLGIYTTQFILNNNRSRRIKTSKGRRN